MTKTDGEFIFKYTTICWNRLVSEIPQTPQVSRIFKKRILPSGLTGRHFWCLPGPTEYLVSERPLGKPLQEHSKSESSVFNTRNWKMFGLRPPAMKMGPLRGRDWRKSESKDKKHKTMVVGREVDQPGGPWALSPIPLLIHCLDISYAASTLGQLCWVLRVLCENKTQLPLVLWGLTVLCGRDWAVGIILYW